MSDTKLSILTHDRQAIEIELDFAYQAESRIREIAFVNKQTAPELCASFNAAYAKLAQSFANLMYRMAQAEIAVKRRKAVLTLDTIPEKMVEKKLGKGNEDIREAFYYTDPDYIQAKDALAAIEAAKELIYIKMNALRMAFEAAKSVLKGDGHIPGDSRGYVTEMPDAPIREVVGVVVAPCEHPTRDAVNVPFAPSVTVPVSNVVVGGPQRPTQTYGGWGVKAKV